MLEQCSTAGHNRMLGSLIPHPKSTHFDTDDEKSSSRPVKRLKREDTGDTSDADSISALKYSVDGSSAQVSEDEEPPQNSQTNLESALPPIKTDQEAIDDYEAYKAA